MHLISIRHLYSGNIHENGRPHIPAESRVLWLNSVSFSSDCWGLGELKIELHGWKGRDEVRGSMSF